MGKVKEAGQDKQQASTEPEKKPFKIVLKVLKQATIK